MTVDAFVTPAILCAVSLLFLVLAQRWLQRHMIGLGLLATGKPDAAVMLYYAVMFPGVLLHELSHWLAARLLLVRTGRLAIWPERDKRGVRLGYIEVEKPDAVRGALIGGAPVVVGALVLVLVTDKALNIGAFAAALASADLAVIRPAFARLVGAPDFWIWLYLVFAVANSMMPSPEDRQSWPTLIGGVLFVLALTAVAGLGELIVTALREPAIDALNLLTAIFTAALVLDLSVIVLVGAVEWMVAKTTGRRVDYTPPPKPAAPDSATSSRRPPTIYERPLPVPAPPRNAPTVEPEMPHTPAPDFDEGNGADSDETNLAEMW